MSGHARQVAAGVGVALLLVGAVAGTAAAAGNVQVTRLTNSEVTAGQTATHTLDVRVDGVSADGTTDVVFVTLPDVYAGNLSFSTVEFRNRTSGETVPVSSSTSVVDGPDDDGVRETLRTGVSHNADYATDELNATYQFDLSHPPVAETTSYDVTVAVEDSATGNAETTATDAITVTAGSGDGGGGDGATDTGDGDTTTGDGAGSGGNGGDGAGDGSGGDGSTSLGGTTLGAVAVLALVIVAAGAILVRQRS